MKLTVKDNCPLDNFNPCRQFECAWFMEVRGTHPNTGEETHEWGCAMAFMPVMMMSTAQQSRQTGAAVESFRNEMVKSNQTSNELMSQSIKLAAERGKNLLEG